MRGNPELVGTEKANFLKWVSAIRSDTGRDQAMLQPDAPTADKPQIKWEVPAGWSPAPASAMRYASFTSADDTGGKIDISIVTFPGDGGNDLDNVNRWRQQIGLTPADESALQCGRNSAENCRRKIFPASTSPELIRVCWRRGRVTTDEHGSSSLPARRRRWKRRNQIS